MAQNTTKPLHMNIDSDLLERIEKYRFKREFSTRTRAMEFLLESALKLDPYPKKQKPTMTKA